MKTIAGRNAIGLVFLSLAAALLLFAASRHGHAQSGRQPTFVGRVWASTDRAASPGTVRIFLPDGTLVMDSCGEGYRLARWSLRAGRLAWQEDTARIEADIVRATSNALHLRLHLVRELKDEHYRPSSIPYVCPEPRASRPGSR